MDSAKRELLLSILSTARRTMDRFGDRTRQNTTRSPTRHLPPIPTLNLPFPDDVTTLICSTPLPTLVSEKLLKQVYSWANQVQQMHQTSFRTTCEKVLEWSSDTTTQRQLAALASQYERSYNDSCISRLRPAFDQAWCNIHGAVDDDRGKRIFNSKYTPVLERYFLLNSYPSATERRLLAQRSGMTPRQIEVWFQNHRNRSKKEDTPLHRCKIGHQHICLDTLEKEVFRKATPALTEDGSSDEDGDSLCDEMSQMDAVAHPFTSLSPAHAFPARYTFTFSYPYDPFPQVNGKFSFATPQWSRRPATTPIERKSVDVDELATLFASKLSFREAATSRPPRTKASRSSADNAWYFATVTIPPRAPLPSFVKSLSTSNASSLSSQQHRRYLPLPSRLASDSSPSSKPRLPRRLPSWSVPSVSPSKITNPPSRTASLESISSCDSSSSGSSLEDLMTPPMTPGPLQGAELIFNDLFDNSLAFDFPNFSLPSTPFSFDASQAKMHGAFPSILSPFQYVTSS